MGSSALEALQNGYQWNGPAILVRKRQEQQVNVIRHNHNCMKMDPLAVLTQAVRDDNFAGGFRQQSAT